MASKLKEALTEEIALEGLDGITINTLWIRLTERKNFSFSLDDNSKPYLWKCILDLKGLEFYQLSQPRPDLIPYNRFHYIDPETKHNLETEHIPEDIYPLKLVDDDGVFGSCLEYKYRKNATEQIRNSKPTLCEVTVKYGNTLVIVASQMLRRRALIGDENDPDFEFDAFSFCILERIGRSRYSGEASHGKLSLQVFKESPKTMFYMMKKLKGLRVLKKQRLIVVKKPSNTKTNCILYHLNRYYQEVGNRLNHELMNLVVYLAAKPEGMEEVFKAKTDLKLFDMFKKLTQHTMHSGERYFEFVDVPWREKYPDAKPKEYLLKSNRQERKIRHIRLIKTVEEVERNLKREAEREAGEVEEGGQDEDEEEEEAISDEAPKLQYNRVFDEPNMYQVMKMINKSGSKGVSQVDLQVIMNASRLAVRRILVFLQKTNYVTTVLEDRGRQKTIMYVGAHNVQANVARQSVKEEMKKFQNITLEPAVPVKEEETPDKPAKLGKKRAKKEMPKIKFNDEKPSDDKVSEIREELSHLDDNQMSNMITPEKLALKREIIKEMTQDAGVRVVIEELTPVPLIDKKTGKVTNGMSRFGTMLTESHVRRANWMLEVIGAIKIVENFRLLKLLRNREKEINLKINMDQKSLKRLVNALIEEDKMKSFKATITMEDRTKEFIYLCAPTTSSEDETLLRMIDEAKLRYFSVSQEELRNRKLLKKVQANAKLQKEKKVEEQRDIPKSALDTIKSHQEYRKRLAEKAPAMKYDRTAGKRYGLLPKMLRIQTAHQYLFYLSYDTHGNPVKSAPRTVANSNGQGITGGEPAPKADANGSGQDKTGRESAPKTDAIGNRQDKTGSEPALEADASSNGQDRTGRDSAPKADASSNSKTGSESEVGADAGGNVSGRDKTGNESKSGMEHWREDKLDIGGAYSQLVENEPVVYSNEMTWRRYLPPVPVHSGYPRGWVLLSDCLLTMPVCLLCEVVNVCYKIEGLEEVLDHPQMKFYPVINLPFSLTAQLLHSKKYVQSFSTLCCYLAEMGLLSFGREVLKEKDQMFIYLHKNASLLDTKESMSGYNKTRAPEGHDFPLKSFHFEELRDLQPYWEILQITAVNSNLGCKSMVHDDLEDDKTFEKKSLKQASASYSPETVDDVGVLPGDQRGGAGLDSSLFSHTLKNWSSSGVLKPPRRYKKLSIGMGLQGGLDVDSKREVVDNFNKNRLKGKERLVLSDNPNKPLALKKVTRDVKGNRGGKGVLKRVHTEVTKTHKIISRMEGKLMKKRCIKIPERLKKRKKPSEKGDDKDKDIYRERCKMRVVWSSKEDSVLLMCRLATLIMDNKKKTALISYMRIRDYLHEKCGAISNDKTSQAIQRRIKFVLKNPETETNLLLYYREAMQDEFVLTNYVSKEFILTDGDLEPKFRTLVEYLLDKFKSLDLQKCSLPDTLDGLRQNYTIQYIGKLQPRKVYSDVKSKADICQDVLRNILHSAVLLQDKQGRTHEMFKLLSQYPDALLSAVVRELRSDGLFVINKKNYLRESATQLQTGMGLRNFKVSQRYLFQYKHKYLSAMFEESAKLLTELCDKHVHGNGEDEMHTLSFHPKSGECAMLFPLILNRWLDVKITMPQELVIVDMEGFYKFPWGRGKNASSQTKGDKVLQDMKTPQTQKLKQTGAREEVSESDTGKKDGGEKESRSANSDKEEADTIETNVGEKESAKNIEEGVRNTKDNSEVVGKDSMEESDSKDSSEKGEQPKKVDETPEDEPANNKDTASEISGVKSGKNTDEKGEKQEKDRFFGKVKEGMPDECTHISTNHCTVVIPDLDQPEVTGELPGTVAGIASRTLLSLRRAEDCSFEEIRIFNAQDNFVVNSCEIGIKIRDNLDEGRAGNPTSKKVATNKSKGSTKKKVDKDNSMEQALLKDSEDVGKAESEQEEMSLKEKMQRVSQLLLDKGRIRNIYTELQRLLPFQINMEQVWTSFKDQATSEEDLKLYKNVFYVIDSHGEIGVRSCDLKKQFKDGYPWREAVHVLMHHNAVLRVGVTCTRFVSLNNARPWVIHAYRNIKGRGLHVDEDTENSMPIEKIDERPKRTSVPDSEPYFYTEPASDVKAASLEVTGEDKITISQEKVENSGKKSTDETSTKKRKLDIERESASDHGVEEVGLDKTDTSENRTSEKRKLSEETRTKIGILAKKRKTDKPSVAGDLDTESTGSVKDGTEIDNTTKDNTDLRDAQLETDHEKVKGASIDNVNSDTVDRENVTKSLEVTEEDKGKTERDSPSKGDKANEESMEKRQTRRIRKRKLPEEAEGIKSDEVHAVSTYDKVRLIIQPWRKPEGGINKPILKMMLESVMLFLMMNPGSPEDVLVKRYAPYLQPMILRNIVDILEDIGCVTRQYICKTKSTLFSKPSIPIIGGEETEDSIALMVPAEDCVIKLGLFGQEIFPNAKWPENTYPQKKPYK